MPSIPERHLVPVLRVDSTVRSVFLMHRGARQICRTPLVRTTAVAVPLQIVSPLGLRAPLTPTGSLQYFEVKTPFWFQKGFHSCVN